MLRLLLFLALLVSESILTKPASGNPVEQLNQFLQAETFTANFTQRVYDERNELIGRSTGTVAIKRPGLFRWEYLQPSRQLIASDGSNFIVYDPELEQATIQPLAISLGQVPIMLLLEQNPSFKDFDVQIGKRQSGLDWVILVPNTQGMTQNMEFTQIELGLTRDSNRNTISQIKMYDHFNQLTVVDFMQANFNVAIAPQTFRFDLPAGTDIIGEPFMPE